MEYKMIDDRREILGSKTSLLKVSSKTYFSFLFTICFSIFVFAQQVEVVAQPVKINVGIDTNNIQIGDQITLELKATYNPQLYKVQFPTIQDTFNHFEVVERLKPDTTSGRDETTFKQQYLITNFDSGQWKIPSMSFDVLSMKGDAPQVALSDSFLVNVNTVQVDTAKPFRPIFGIRSAKMPLGVLIMYIAAAILVLAVLGFLIWYFIKTMREKNNKPEHKEPEIILLPHEKALKELKQLEELQLWQAGEEKNYHTQLTDIIRTYLNEQFKLDCFEKTSSEIIQQIKRVKPLSTSRQPLRTIFETADMVKFAKSKPTAEEHIQSMELAIEMIRETYKRVKPIEENEETKNNTTN